MSSTKNINGNRKILLAKYEPCEGVLKIPDGIDLDDETAVSKYMSTMIHYILIMSMAKKRQ